MKVIFVRHGETDYSLADQRELTTIEMNFCPLTEEGMKQAEEAAINQSLQPGNLIISSPYTRALQTAEILNRQLELPLRVEFDLHEWNIDLEGKYLTREEQRDRIEDFFAHKGVYPEGEKKPWESLGHLRKRFRGAIGKYKEYSPVIVVCHGMIIQCQTRFLDDGLPFCGIVNFDFDFKL